MMRKFLFWMRFVYLILRDPVYIKILRWSHLLENRFKRKVWLWNSQTRVYQEYANPGDGKIKLSWTGKIRK